MSQPDLEPVAEALAEIADALAEIADDLPSELDLTQFSYMIFALAKAYGLSGDDLLHAAANASINLDVATAH